MVESKLDAAENNYFADQLTGEPYGTREGDDDDQVTFVEQARMVYQRNSALGCSASSSSVDEEVTGPHQLLLDAETEHYPHVKHKSFSNVYVPQLDFTTTTTQLPSAGSSERQTAEDQSQQLAQEDNEEEPRSNSQSSLAPSFAETTTSSSLHYQSSHAAESSINSLVSSVHEVASVATFPPIQQPYSWRPEQQPQTIASNGSVLSSTSAKNSLGSSAHTPKPRTHKLLRSPLKPQHPPSLLTPTMRQGNLSKSNTQNRLRDASTLQQGPPPSLPQTAALGTSFSSEGSASVSADRTPVLAVREVSDAALRREITHVGTSAQQPNFRSSGLQRNRQQRRWSMGSVAPNNNSEDEAPPETDLLDSPVQLRQTAARRRMPRRWSMEHHTSFSRATVSDLYASRVQSGDGTDGTELVNKVQPSSLPRSSTLEESSSSLTLAAIPDPSGPLQRAQVSPKPEASGRQVSSSVSTMLSMSSTIHDSTGTFSTLLTRELAQGSSQYQQDMLDNECALSDPPPQNVAEKHMEKFSASVPNLQLVIRKSPVKAKSMKVKPKKQQSLGDEERSVNSLALDRWAPLTPKREQKPKVSLTGRTPPQPTVSTAILSTASKYNSSVSQISATDIPKLDELYRDIVDILRCDSGASSQSRKTSRSNPNTELGRLSQVGPANDGEGEGKAPRKGMARRWSMDSASLGEIKVTRNASGALSESMLRSIVSAPGRRQQRRASGTCASTVDDTTLLTWNNPSSMPSLCPVSSAEEESWSLNHRGSMTSTLASTLGSPSSSSPQRSLTNPGQPFANKNYHEYRAAEYSSSTMSSTIRNSVGTNSAGTPPSKRDETRPTAVPAPPLSAPAPILECSNATPGNAAVLPQLRNHRGQSSKITSPGNVQGQRKVRNSGLNSGLSVSCHSGKRPASTKNMLKKRTEPTASGQSVHSGMSTPSKVASSRSQPRQIGSTNPSQLVGSGSGSRASSRASRSGKPAKKRPQPGNFSTVQDLPAKERFFESDSNLLSKHVDSKRTTRRRWSAGGMSSSTGPGQVRPTRNIDLPKECGPSGGSAGGRGTQETPRRWSIGEVQGDAGRGDGQSTGPKCTSTAAPEPRARPRTKKVKSAKPRAAAGTRPQSRRSRTPPTQRRSGQPLKDDVPGRTVTAKSNSAGVPPAMRRASTGLVKGVRPAALRRASTGLPDSSAAGAVGGNVGKPRPAGKKPVQLKSKKTRPRPIKKPSIDGSTGNAVWQSQGSATSTTSRIDESYTESNTIEEMPRSRASSPSSRSPSKRRRWSLTNLGRKGSSPKGKSGNRRHSLHLADGSTELPGKSADKVPLLSHSGDSEAVNKVSADSVAKPATSQTKNKPRAHDAAAARGPEIANKGGGFAEIRQEIRQDNGVIVLSGKKNSKSSDAHASSKGGWQGNRRNRSSARSLPVHGAKYQRRNSHDELPLPVDDRPRRSSVEIPKTLSGDSAPLGAQFTIPKIAPGSHDDMECLQRPKKPKFQKHKSARNLMLSPLKAVKGSLKRSSLQPNAKLTAASLIQPDSQAAAPVSVQDSSVATDVKGVLPSEISLCPLESASRNADGNADGRPMSRQVSEVSVDQLFSRIRQAGVTDEQLMRLKGLGLIITEG